MILNSSDVIGSIYEAAVLPELWPSVLEQLCEISGAWGAALVAIDSAQKTRFTTTPTYRDAYGDFARSGLVFASKRTERHVASRYGGFSRDLDHCTQEELDTDEIYRRVLYPNGLSWTLGSVVSMPTGDTLVFDFVHRRTDGPFLPEAAEILNEYRPHLARAGLLSSKLGLERARQAVETLAQLGLPGAVLTSAGRVLQTNADFEAMAPRITIGAYDRLGMADAAALALLQHSLETIASDEMPAIRSIPVGVTLDSPALIVHLVPIRRSAHDIFARSNCLMIVTPVLAPDAPLTEMLNGLFDLTPAEARLAKALASGTTTTTFAADARVSPETVKTQLKSVFKKTGTARQADLVRLLAATSPLKGAD